MELMVTDVGDAELMQLVRASPAAVAAQDKQAWLALWARDYVLEDPVGSRPVRGRLLGRFWDAFIAGNDIRFEVYADFRAGDRVLRDVTIHTTLATGVQAATPAHLVYELVREDGQLRIGRMGAHWQVWPVYVQLLRPTRAHVRALTTMTDRMLRQLGPGGALAFAGALHSVGEPGKESVRRLVRAAGCGDAGALRTLGGRVPTNLTKLIASGRAVTASCQVDGRPAALLAEIAGRTGEVARVDVFTEPVRGAS